MIKYLQLLILSSYCITFTDLAYGSSLRCNQASSDWFRFTTMGDTSEISFGSSSESMKNFVDAALFASSNYKANSSKGFRYFEAKWNFSTINCVSVDNADLEIKCSSEAPAKIEVEVLAYKWRNQAKSPVVFSFNVDNLHIATSIDQGEDKLVFIAGKADLPEVKEFKSQLFEHTSWTYDGRRQAPECMSDL